jgi:hypothetical protein
MKRVAMTKAANREMISGRCSLASFAASCTSLAASWT